MADKVLLKHAALAFIGNLCVDPQLRLRVAANLEEVLATVYLEFERDAANKGLMWQESATRELGVLINTAIETQGQQFLVGRGAVMCVEKLLTGVQYKGEDIEVINRSFNLLAKLSKDAIGAQQIANSKSLVISTLLYFNR